MENENHPLYETWRALRRDGSTRMTFEQYRACTEKPNLTCPECGEAVWDTARGHKLAKCWNADGHASGGTLAFDTMPDDNQGEDA